MEIAIRVIRTVNFIEYECYVIEKIKNETKTLYVTENYRVKKEEAETVQNKHHLANLEYGEECILNEMRFYVRNKNIDSLEELKKLRKQIEIAEEKLNSIQREIKELKND